MAFLAAFFLVAAFFTVFFVSVGAVSPGFAFAAFLRDFEDQVNTLVFDSVDAFDGSISAEHGVGSLKVDKLEKHKSPVALDMMRAIKKALDPHNLMNPGRVVRV